MSLPFVRIMHLRRSPRGVVREAWHGSRRGRVGAQYAADQGCLWRPQNEEEQIALALGLEEDRQDLDLCKCSNDATASLFCPVTACFATSATGYRCSERSDQAPGEGDCGCNDPAAAANEGMSAASMRC